MSAPAQAITKLVPSLNSSTRRRPFVWRWTKRAVLTSAALIAVYALAAFTLSRIPVNREFVQPDDGIKIAVISNGVHVDLALPVRNEHYDWMKHFRQEDVVHFDGKVQFAIFGWGERTFYLETPTWSDVKPLNFLRAFCGAGRSVMHVDLASWRPAAGEQCRWIKLNAQQYKILCREILATIQTDEAGRAVAIAGAHYQQSDAFYEAHGHYHLFHTCNAWAGDVLRISGVRVGVWTPTTGGVFACLPPAEP